MARIAAMKNVLSPSSVAKIMRILLMSAGRKPEPDVEAERGTSKGPNGFSGSTIAPSRSRRPPPCTPAWVRERRREDKRKSERERWGRRGDD